MPPYPLNGPGLTVELNRGLEKSGKSQGISYCLESGNPVFVTLLENNKIAGYAVIAFFLFEEI